MKHNGFGYGLAHEGGIIEYARRAREQGAAGALHWQKTLSLMSGWASGSPRRYRALSSVRRAATPILNCLNDGRHLLFIQCPSCAEKFGRLPG